MTMSKKALQREITAQLDTMDAAGLRAVLDLIKTEKQELANNYQLFARDVFVDRTRNISKRQMPPMFEDAIVEALSIMVSPDEAKEIKKLARRYSQQYKAEEAAAWARQFMLAYRTGIYYAHASDGSCKVCNIKSGIDSFNEVVMLHVGLQAGPFCKKCLHRIPKSWYCQA